MRAAVNAEFLGQHAQAGVGSDEVHGANASITLDREQKLPQKHRPAGASGSDGQILRRVIRQKASSEAAQA